MQSGTGRGAERIWGGHIQAAEATQASGRSYFNCLPHDGNGDGDSDSESERARASERALWLCVSVCVCASRTAA